MNKNHFLVLLAVVIGLVVITFLGQESELTSIADENKATQLFPSLKQQQDEIAELSLSQGEKSVHISKVDGSWVVKEKFDYPANTKTIRELVSAITEMNLVEKKTKKANNYPLLNIDDNAALVVEVKGKDSTLAKAMFGKKATNFDGQFVRLPEDAQVWLGDKTIEADIAASAWIVDEILDIDANEVKTVERIKADQKFTLVNKNGKFTFEQVPEDKELGEEYLFSGIRSALSDLKAKDVVLVDSLDWENAVVSKYQTNSIIYSIHHVEKDDKHYIKLTASEAPKSESETEAVGATAEAVDLAALNARWGKWAYEIASYKAEGVSRGLDELLVAKAEEEAQEES